MIHRILVIVAVCGLFSGFVGCKDDLQSLEGTVTIDGQLAPAGIGLRFVPVNGNSPSYAVTDKNGKYVAAFTFKRKGIEVGEHRVHLMPGGADAAAGPRGSREKMPSENEKGSYAGSSDRGGTRGQSSIPAFPSRYYQQIMMITVEPGHNTIDIPLKSEAQDDQ